MATLLRPDIELADGTSLRVRPATIDDIERLHALYDALSPEDRYRRFFSAVVVSRPFLERWITGSTVVVAERLPSGEIVGDAGYAPLADGNGELGITIARGWRGWLGPYLLDVLCDVAAANGVANIEAEILLDNSGMLALARSRGAATMEHPDQSIVRLVIPTAGSAPTWPVAHERPRVLVELKGGRWAGEEAARAAGLDVRICSGPGARRRHDCPVLRGEPCPLARDADAILFALDPTDDVNRRLRAGHDEEHPEVPVLDRTTLPACAPAAEVAALLRILGRSRG